MLARITQPGELHLPHAPNPARGEEGPCVRAPIAAAARRVAAARGRSTPRSAVEPGRGRSERYGDRRDGGKEHELVHGLLLSVISGWELPEVHRAARTVRAPLRPAA